jgi:hypothetical protein
MAYDYRTLEVSIDHGVAFATINAPPINIMNADMFGDLYQFAEEVAVGIGKRSCVLAQRSSTGIVRQGRNEGKRPRNGAALILLFLRMPETEGTVKVEAQLDAETPVRAPSRS